MSHGRNLVLCAWNGTVIVSSIVEKQHLSTYYTPSSFSAPSSSDSTSTSFLLFPSYVLYPKPEPAPPPPPLRILSTRSLPSTAATAVFLRGARTAFAPPPDMLAPPPFALNTVFRLFADANGSACLVGGGGGTENRARSWSSVSRIKLVISWFCSSELVNCFGGAKLVVLVEINAQYTTDLLQFRD